MNLKKLALGTSSRSTLRRASIAAAATLALGSSLTAYNFYGPAWDSMPVPVYVNPSTPDLDAASVEAAMRVAMDEWTLRSGSPFEYLYVGRTSATTTSQDGRNVILFRNASNGSAIATTYAWWSGTKRLDADIVFWDASFTFFSGTTGCSGGGAYIEDIAVHELGHALGLHHSSEGDATMYPSYSYCAQHMRSLAADDIAGAQALYGSSSNGSPSNSAPAVSIDAPTSSSSFAEGATIAFSGTALDSQDGDLTQQLSWTSSIDGAIGAGASFTRTLSPGSHVITARVSDSGGLSASKQIGIAVVAEAAPSPAPAPVPTGPALTADGYKVKGLQKVQLRWSGFSASSVAIRRNESIIRTTANDGAELDAVDVKGKGTYRYQVCEAGTSTCTNEVTVQF